MSRVLLQRVAGSSAKFLRPCSASAFNATPMLSVMSRFAPRAANYTSGGARPSSLGAPREVFEKTLDLYDIRPEVLAPLTPEEQNQADHEAYKQAKVSIYVLCIFFGGVLLISYVYNKELDHFKNHRHIQEPYSYFIKRDNQVAAGLWPGRACQFFEFNCYAATYDAADKLLKEQAEGRLKKADH